MPTSIDFTLKKSKGSEERVTLARGNATIVLSFNKKGKASATLDTDVLYFVRWYFLGAEDDEMSVTYSYVAASGARSGELIKTFKLDGRYARPYPGGLWIDDGTTGFVAEN